MKLSIVKHCIYPLYQLVTGRRVLSKWHEFERTQWLSQSEVERLQKQRLRDLLVHAYTYVPFYRRRFDVLEYRPEKLAEPESFSQLPLLTKEDILTRGDEMVATNFPPSALKLNFTGGSTGHTLSFFNDRISLDFRSAVTIRGDRWAGLDIGTSHARLWGAPLDLQHQEKLANRWINRMLNRLWLDCFRLSEQILANYAQQLQRFRPRVQVLMGYATALTTMAKYFKANNIHEIRLQSVISSAETLLDEQRKQIEATFKCKVYDRYGCREAGPMIVECEEGSMHINADYVHLELLRNGQPAQPGELGEIVITPLYSYGMPLIRYNVGDLGIAAEQVLCACGRGLPLVERVVGRTSDMMVNAKGDLFHGEYFTHLFYNQPGVRQFQVIQPDTQHLIFKIVLAQDFSSDLLSGFERRILDFVGPMEIQWEKVNEIPPLRSGKHSFTISMVPVDFTTSNVSID